MTNLAQKKCISCEVGSIPITPNEAHAFMMQIPLWSITTDSKQISKTFLFKDFAEAMQFVNKIADIANVEGHHPDLYVSWGKVVVNLSTHAVSGLSENDFILASKIDSIA